MPAEYKLGDEQLAQFLSFLVSKGEGAAPNAAPLPPAGELVVPQSQGKSVVLPVTAVE